MAGNADRTKLGWPWWQQALLIALLTVLIGNRLVLVVDTFTLRAGLSGEITYTGAIMDANEVSDDGFIKVADVEPESPMANAGVRPGDTVRYEPSYLRLVRPSIGDRRNFTLDHGGERSQRQVIIKAAPQTEESRQRDTMLAVNALALLVSMLIGCLILWRGWGNRSAMLLGAVLASLGVGGVSVPPWASAAIVAIPMWSLILATAWLANFIILFAMRMFEEGARPLPRWQWGAATLWLLVVGILGVVGGIDLLAATNYSELLGAGAPPLLISALSMLVGIAILVAAWRKAVPAKRNRLAVLIFALVAYLVCLSVTSWNFNRTGGFFDTSGASWPSYFVALMMGLIAPGLLAYAVLRHRLFDMGFAINRTLVFATISVILLVSFGTLEWAVEHTIPASWREGGPFFSAGIAVGLFLLFHRIRAFVEHGIERVFFRSWQQNEAALKRFVASAAHVEKPAALAGHFVTELGRFTGDAAAALYVRTPEGDYASAAGETIDADDSALTAMRAEQGPVVPAEVHSPIPAALALPMMHQAMLAGFVLLGPKPTGEDYRPDEIEILGWAVRQVGLDLQALRVRDLEQQVITLQARNDGLAEVLARATAG